MQKNLRNGWEERQIATINISSSQILVYVVLPQFVYYGANDWL